VWNAVCEGGEPEVNYESASAALSDVDVPAGRIRYQGVIEFAVPTGVRSVALGISPDFIHHGVVPLMGLCVASAKQAC